MNFKIPLKLKIGFLHNNCLQTTIFVLNFLDTNEQNNSKNHIDDAKNLFFPTCRYFHDL
jgi:hypothetical protein